MRGRPMPAPPHLDETDRGETAVAELARDDYKRRKFLTMVGGTGAAGALSLLIAACGGSDSSGSGSSSSSKPSAGGSTGSTGAPPAGTFGKGDLGIVNYALTLEYLEAQFYKEVVAS